MNSMILIITFFLYFIILFISFKYSERLAEKCIIKGYSLAKIKFIVWFYLNSLILILTSIVIIVTLFYFELISINFFLTGLLLLSITISLLFIYLQFKFC